MFEQGFVIVLFFRLWKLCLNQSVHNSCSMIRQVSRNTQIHPLYEFLFTLIFTLLLPEPLCDELLAWLCSELSEEDASLLVMCLRLRRSSVQLAKLRAPNSLTLQIFHILTTWRQALPTITPKCPLLAHCLTQIGRPELAAELLKKRPGCGQEREETCRNTKMYNSPWPSTCMRLRAKHETKIVIMFKVEL